MTIPIFVSSSDEPNAFHRETCWAPRLLSSVVVNAAEPGKLEQFVFSELVQEALHVLEHRGEVVDLVPFPLFKETSPPADVVQLDAFLDEFVHQRLHFAKQTMYPNRKVGTDEFLWSLCHRRLVAEGYVPVEQLPAAVPRKAAKRAPVTEDFRFSSLYKEVYTRDAPVQASNEDGGAEHSSSENPLVDRLQLVSSASMRKLVAEVGTEDPRFSFLDRLGSRSAIPLAKAPTLEEIESLRESCPNFDEVLDFVERQAVLCRAGDVPFAMPPILLLGPPGVGKTHFARQLGKRVGVDFKFVPMNSVSAGFTLTGMHRTWQKATPGLVAKTLLDSDFGNPLFLLDEIDKSAAHSQHGTPVDALYQLLEPETSNAFVDEFFDVPMDASRVLWIATANEASSLPGPLLSRFKVFSLPALTTEQTLFVAHRVMRDITTRFQLSFDCALDDACAKRLSAFSARDMRILLTDALGSALRNGRNALSSRDLEVAEAAGERKKQGLGFLG